MAGDRGKKAKLKEPFSLPFVHWRTINPIQIKSWRPWWPTVTVNLFGLSTQASVRQTSACVYEDISRKVWVGKTNPKCRQLELSLTKREKAFCAQAFLPSRSQSPPWTQLFPLSFFRARTDCIPLNHELQCVVLHQVLGDSSDVNIIQSSTQGQRGDSICQSVCQKAEKVRRISLRGAEGHTSFCFINSQWT